MTCSAIHSTTCASTTTTTTRFGMGYASAQAGKSRDRWLALRHHPAVIARTQERRFRGHPSPMQKGRSAVEAGFVRIRRARARAAGLVCISCRTRDSGYTAVGHFLPAPTRAAHVHRYLHGSVAPSTRVVLTYIRLHGRMISLSYMRLRLHGQGDPHGLMPARAWHPHGLLVYRHPIGSVVPSTRMAAFQVPHGAALEAHTRGRTCTRNAAQTGADSTRSKAWHAGSLLGSSARSPRAPACPAHRPQDVSERFRAVGVAAPRGQSGGRVTRQGL